jgi:hypothetical protein
MKMMRLIINNNILLSHNWTEMHANFWLGNQKGIPKSRWKDNIRMNHRERE